MVTYFENLTVGSHVFYVLNIHVKFCANHILFTIQSISLFFMLNFKVQKKLKFKHLTNDIAIDFWCSRNFESMKDIRGNGKV